jgi:molybdopterin-binding protein
MKISARNVLRGKVKEVTKGAVNAEVKVDIGGGLVLVSVITNSSVETLNLKAGSDVYAVIKASNVMIATD